MTRSTKSTTARAAKASTSERSLDAMLERARVQIGLPLAEKDRMIAKDVTFRQWCEHLAAAGLKVDGKPFTLADRPAFGWIYDQVPSTIEECQSGLFVLMKCAQVGFTVMEMLASLYLGIKFGPVTVGMFMPDQASTEMKSTERFLPVVRSIPDVQQSMAGVPGLIGRKASEGRASRRRIMGSLFVFSYTSGRSSTESVPMDFLSFDEVQNMTIEQLEKTSERLSGSRYGYTMMGSTPNWPGLDIDFYYQKGTQHKFHTRCLECDDCFPLSDNFPNCIKEDGSQPASDKDPYSRYRYVCRNGHWIDDAQHGEWIATNPEAPFRSAQFPQMLSPTVSAGKIWSKWENNQDRRNFYNRVLGRTYVDPSQTPVTQAHLDKCVAAGQLASLRWKKGSAGSYMGVDQMGGFNVVVIKERLTDGRSAVIHLEEIYDDNPFERVSELVRAYNVRVCVVEQLPNYNDAKRFSHAHRGLVFLCNGYGNLAEDMVRWGDRSTLDASDRRTEEEGRDRFTVRLDQYKAMSWSLSQFSAAQPVCLFPDPRELSQDVLEKGVMRRMTIAHRAFNHFTKTALVTEIDHETGRPRRMVKKVGLDPHFSFANMLCDIAMTRAEQTTAFVFPEGGGSAHERWRSGGYDVGGPADQLREAVETFREIHAPEGTCGRCVSCPREEDGVLKQRWLCDVYRQNVSAEQPGCWQYVSA